MHFSVIKIKNHILPCFFLLFTISLVVFSSSNLIAAKSGLILWATSVVPSLFPFFVATEMLSQTSIPYLLGKIFNIFMKPIFNIRGEGSFALIMGIISGYPVGAKIACNFRKNHILSKEESERLLSFTNNSRAIIYNRNCRNQYVWQFYYRFLTFNYTYFSMFYCRMYI